MVAEITDNDIFMQAMSHVGERRRKRIKGYYICSVCDNQFINNRPDKMVKCPICFENCVLGKTIDEFSIEQINLYTDTLITDETDDDTIYAYRLHYFNRKDLTSSRSQRIKRFIAKGENIEP